MAKQQVARVLVIDDEPDLRELMADALAADDVEILTAGTAQEAADVAAKNLVDLVVADLHLPDGTGADVIGNLRNLLCDLPAVVVTGVKEAETIADATRVGLVELMTKPLDIQRLQETVRRELDSQRSRRRTQHRTLRLRDLARAVNIERKEMGQQLDSTCADLTNAYRQLSGQMAMQQVVLNYQNQLVSTKSDDDVFRVMFQTFVKRSGPLFGAAMVCDEEAELRVIGRFGVPTPDGLSFCKALAKPIVAGVLGNPICSLTEAGDEAELFDESVRRYLPGLSILAIPLLPEPGELIGIAMLYRKGEQPFLQADTALAEMIAQPTALAVQRND